MLQNYLIAGTKHWQHFQRLLLKQHRIAVDDISENGQLFLDRKYPIHVHECFDPGAVGDERPNPEWRL